MIFSLGRMMAGVLALAFVLPFRQGSSKGLQVRGAGGAWQRPRRWWSSVGCPRRTTFHVVAICFYGRALSDEWCLWASSVGLGRKPCCLRPPQICPANGPPSRNGWPNLGPHAEADGVPQPSQIFLTGCAHEGHLHSDAPWEVERRWVQKGFVSTAMPRMAEPPFLATNGRRSQLVELGNIDVFPLQDERAVSVLHDEVTVTPLRVPHRDEFSETVGYRIAGPKRTALFIPDIDKWSTWDHSLTQELASVDFAFVDATFYDATEVNHRDMSEIPHPFAVETMATLGAHLPIDGAHRLVHHHSCLSWTLT